MNDPRPKGKHHEKSGQKFWNYLFRDQSVAYPGRVEMGLYCRIYAGAGLFAALAGGHSGLVLLVVDI